MTRARTVCTQVMDKPRKIDNKVAVRASRPLICYVCHNLQKTMIKKTEHSRLQIVVAEEIVSKAQENTYQNQPENTQPTYFSIDISEHLQKFANDWFRCFERNN